MSGASRPWPGARLRLSFPPDMSMLKLHPVVIHAALEDLIAAVRELQDLSRDVAFQAQNLAETLREDGG